jgi:hypothetical protein
MDRCIDVDYLSPVVEQHNEAVQDIESHSGFRHKCLFDGAMLVTVSSETNYKDK